MPAPTLTEVRRLPDEGAVRLTWSDGHSAVFGYQYLRGYCPCAMCQGHNVTEIQFHQPAGKVTPLDIHPVGNYAISFDWSDGHSTGIYRFDFLREICPCETCKAERA